MTREEVLKQLINRLDGNPRERVKELFQEIDACIERCQQSELEARQALADYSKEVEVARLHQEIEQLRQEMGQSIHVLTEEEAKKADKFARKHYKNCKTSTYYQVHKTGLGTTCYVVCPACGEQEDITSYDLW